MTAGAVAVRPLQRACDADSDRRAASSSRGAPRPRAVCARSRRGRAAGPALVGDQRALGRGAGGSCSPRPVAGGPAAASATCRAVARDELVAAGPALVARASPAPAAVRVAAPTARSARVAGRRRRRRSFPGSCPCRSDRPTPVWSRSRTAACSCARAAAAWRSPCRRAPTQSHVAFAGGLGVAPVPEGALIVFDLRPGRDRAAPDLARAHSMASTSPGWRSPRRATSPRPCRRATAPTSWSGRRRAPNGFESSRAAGASGAWPPRAGAWRSSTVGLREGVRVAVVDGATRPRAVFRGPAAFDVGAAELRRARARLRDARRCRLLVGCGARAPGVPPGRACGPTSRSTRLAGAATAALRVACINAPTRRVPRARAGERADRHGARAAGQRARRRGPARSSRCGSSIPDGRTRVCGNELRR